uniref:Reverse transcriptase domain-containing protein n=1 Tax=Tanacetum cinerariifolium TaxID=118510 RepID=A0A699IU45_TANCI|nr:hypothetical protein [Tanacetum cinerariifolium]
MKCKAKKVCHEEMVKMPLVDLKVLEDGSFRICMDYRKLSEIAIRNRCHQMRVHEEEIPKTNFRIRYGHFEFMVMPSGHLGLHEVKGGARVAFEDEFRAAEEREVLCEAQQGRSGMKRKLFGSFSNKMGNEPILALPEGSDNFVVMHKARAWWFCLRMLEALGVQDKECDLDGSRASTTHFQSEGLKMRQRRWMKYFSDYGCETKYHMRKANIVVDAWRRNGRVEKSKVENASTEMLRGLDQLEKRYGGRLYFLDRTWILMVGDVRTLIMEVAHATKYSVRPGAEIRESKMIGLQMEQEMTKVVVIKERLKEAKDRVVRFGRKGELAPRMRFPKGEDTVTTMV